MSTRVGEIAEGGECLSSASLHWEDSFPPSGCHSQVTSRRSLSSRIRAGSAKATLDLARPRTAAPISPWLRHHPILGAVLQGVRSAGYGFAMFRRVALCLSGEPPQARPLLPDARTSNIRLHQSWEGKGIFCHGRGHFKTVAPDAVGNMPRCSVFSQLSLARLSPRDSNWTGLTSTPPGAQGRAGRAGRRISSDSWALAAPQAGGSFASPVRGHGPRKPLLLSAPLGSEPELILARWFWGQSTRARHTAAHGHGTSPHSPATRGDSYHPEM